jgi:glycosyltransferase involved in cell wall biosynthesis
MILFVGREFERKGGPLILDAFRRTRSKLPDARLVIVGCKPDIHGEGVEVLGLINKEQPGGLEQLLKLYSEASLFCIMSTYEPFGIVVLEAQLAGVPCVLPEAFAFPEMVKNGKTGLLVSQYDADVLADAFCTLLSNPAELAIMGQMAHTHVEQRYTWARAASCICAKIGHDLDNDA